MWTTFWDMHSGGKQKLPWSLIFIEADEKEAKDFFEIQFRRNPEHVTCNCCGGDYSIDTDNNSLEQVTGYHRHCADGYVEVVTGCEVSQNEAWKSGESLLDGFAYKYFERQRYFSFSPDKKDGNYETLKEFELRDDVLIIRRIRELQSGEDACLLNKSARKQLTA
jgi:hypothetical protein